ncbi:hypothetical protein FRB91_006058 [Serendipita sp. 411]|nr:hypothetical protein FRB91_006058 [Serendipita sp. 411]
MRSTSSVAGPSLTLFSGPTCSLCDTAKTMLKEIQTEIPFSLQTIDIHAPGQEQWKKRYVYDIPVLHLEGKTIAKGRWDKESIQKVLQEWHSNANSTKTS